MLYYWLSLKVLSYAPKMITQEYAFILKTFIFRLKPQIEDKQVIATHENLYGKK